MKRLIVLFANLSLGLFSVFAIAQSKFQEHKHFEDAAPDVSAKSLPKTVAGFFWYGCGHCYAFEPTLDKWLESKPSDISFTRVPAVLGRNWIPHAQAFYATEKLGISEKTHQALFDAIHKDRQPLFEPTAIAEFLAKVSGEDAAKILMNMNNQGTREQIGQSIETAQKYRLRGVPTILVGEKYLVDPSAVGDELGAVIDYLLSR